MPEHDDIETEGEQITVQRAVTVAIGKMLYMLDKGEFKMTIGEFTRLVEFDKQISVEEITHVKVTWVSPFEETEYES